MLSLASLLVLVLVLPPSSVTVVPNSVSVLMLVSILPPGLVTVVLNLVSLSV